MSLRIIEQKDAEIARLGEMYERTLATCTELRNARDMLIQESIHQVRELDRLRKALKEIEQNGGSWSAKHASRALSPEAK
jgi:hypothetical protein